MSERAGKKVCTIIKSKIEYVDDSLIQVRRIIPEKKFEKDEDKEKEKEEIVEEDLGICRCPRKQVCICNYNLVSIFTSL